LAGLPTTVTSLYDGDVIAPLAFSLSSSQAGKPNPGFRIWFKNYIQPSAKVFSCLNFKCWILMLNVFFIMLNGF